MDSSGHVDGSREALLGELEEFLRMPSISAREDENGGFRDCAGWVAEKLRAAGAEASVMETRASVVTRCREVPRRSSLTVTTTAAAAPLDLWETDPSTLSVTASSTPAARRRQAECFATGVALYIEEPEPPLKLKFLIEGEGSRSPNLAPFSVQAEFSPPTLPWEAR